MSLFNPLSGIGASAFALPAALERLAESAPGVEDYGAEHIAVADGRGALNDDPVWTDDLPVTTDETPPARPRITAA